MYWNKHETRKFHANFYFLKRIDSARIDFAAQNTISACCLLFARQKMNWWSQTGSNRRPEACKATALPTELWPLSNFGEAERQNTNAHYSTILALSLICFANVTGAPFLALPKMGLVGRGRFELPTSRLSVVRSNQLSYRPLFCASA